MAAHSIPRSTVARRSNLTYVAAAVVIVLVVGFAVLSAFAVRELVSMAGNLQMVSTRLGTLEAVNQKLGDMDQKLDRLQTVAGGLATMRTELNETNAQLGATNRSTDAMRGSLTRMESDIRTLSSIRGDIHLMVHKIAGSFLFKSVK